MAIFFYLLINITYFLPKKKKISPKGYKYRKSYTEPMKSDELFSWLSQYHLDANIKPNLSSIVNGQYFNSQNTKPIEEGEENHQTYGALILADGDNLVRRLKKERIILDLSTPMFSPADNYDLFAGYLSNNKKKDGAFVYDGKNMTITRISRYNNHSSPSMQEVRENYQQYMPAKSS